MGRVDDRLVELVAEPSEGRGLQVVGLPEDRCRTTSDRVRAALVNSGVLHEAPSAAVRLQPALRAGATNDLDLPIALAALSAVGAVGEDLRWIFATGRLGLDGTVCAPGVAGRPSLADVVGECQTPSAILRTYVRGGKRMSELRSAIESLRAEVLTDLPDARAKEDFAELQRACELLGLERLRRLADLERRRAFERDGHLSAASWLASTYKVVWGAAREQVRAARALEEMPETRRAVDEGDLSMSAARVLVTARDADPEAFQQAEAELVEAARIHSMQDLQRVASYWRQTVERERAMEGEAKLRAQRKLHASVTFLGMVRVDGDLDPETGETLLAALRAVLDAESRSTREGDDRTPAQRRADALGEICRQWLDLGDRPTVGGERPHVTVTVDTDSLRGDGGETSEMDHVGPVDPAVARRIACDASIRRVVMAGRSEPLDVGRRTPVVPPALRQAVVIRDRHCRFPSCDRPHTWCDAHHIVHWAEGGPTALPNLVLLCRRHHRMVHQPGGFTLKLVDGRPVFGRPDGSILEDRAPP